MDCGNANLFYLLCLIKREVAGSVWPKTTGAPTHSQEEELMPVLAEVPTVNYPADAPLQINFAEAIQIRWPELEGSRFHLCVGTQPGNWDILSVGVGVKKHLMELSEIPVNQAVYVQVISFRADDDGIVGPIMEMRHNP